jgi:hypothetical protein
MWRHKLDIWKILLVGGTCLLLMGIYATWWGPGQATSRSSAAKGPLVPTAPILRDQKPLAAFELVAGKNLFSQDRIGPRQGQAKSQNILEGYQLLGTIIVGDTRAALIGPKMPQRDKKGAEVEVVYLGEQWNGFKAMEISIESVVFQAKDGQKTLTFPE